MYLEQGSRNRYTLPVRGWGGCEDQGLRRIQRNNSQGTHNRTNIGVFRMLIGMPGSRRPWDCKCHAICVSNQAHTKQEINDLATCPTNPSLIASASDDTTVRIWSLDPADEKQPCVCILGGEGHSSGLLTVVGVPRYVRLDGTDLLLMFAHRRFTTAANTFFRLAMTIVSVW